MNETTPKKTVERMDIEDILEAIPHRYPFLMIDRVIDVIPDESAIGIKNVSINEIILSRPLPAPAGDAGRADHRIDGTECCRARGGDPWPGDGGQARVLHVDRRLPLPTARGARAISFSSM